MYQTATITSKRQLTIPADMYRRMNFVKQQKVILTLEARAIRIEPAVDLVNQLAGSLPLPRSFEGKDTERIIAEAKREYMKRRTRSL